MGEFVVYERSGYAGALAANEAAGEPDGGPALWDMPPIVEMDCDGPDPAAANEGGGAVTLLRPMPAICPQAERKRPAANEELVTADGLVRLVMPRIVEGS